MSHRIDHTKVRLSEDLLRSMVEEGFTHKQIADAFGHHPANIAIACSVLGIRGTPGRRPAKPQYRNEFLGSLS